MTGPQIQASIAPYEDGPYLIRGPFRIVDHEGRVLETHRRTVALCRCGRSRLRPLCDGTHRAIAFKAPAGIQEQGETTDGDGC